MNDDISKILTFIHRWEGGYVNDPADKGGATNQGVTQRTYDAWRKQHGKAPQPVKDILAPEVEDIFREGYWRAAHCDELAWPLNLAVADTAFNSGPGRAIKLLQRAVGASPDGVFGPGTLARVQEADALEAFHTFVALRRAFFQAIVKNDASQQKFLNGWLKRADSLERYGVSRGVSFSTLDPLDEVNAENSPSAKAYDADDLELPEPMISPALPTTSTGFVQRLMETLGRAVADASRLEVRTYTSPAPTALGGDAGALQRQAQLRAFTRFSLDGDAEVLAPLKEDGSVNQELWQLHMSTVEAAQKQRADLLKEALSLASTFSSPFSSPLSTKLKR